MKWRDYKKEKPYVGQYCVGINNKNIISIFIFSEKKEFQKICGDLKPNDIKKWSPCFINLMYEAYYENKKQITDKKVKKKILEE